MSSSLIESAQSLLSSTSKRRPRVLIYIQDSWGLGHIQLVSKLARIMQECADCLVLCGHREAGWIFPEKCEYVRIPSLNTPLSKGSEGVFWGRHSFLQLSDEQAIRFRKTMIESTIDAFCPDVIIVENRPLGMMDELDGILDKTEAVKVFLTRGIMTHPNRVRLHYLNAVQERALAADLFQKVIVAADQKVWDFSAEYKLRPEISAKLDYVGYMSEPIRESQIQAARVERGLKEDTRWIVCSAGGGALGERLIQEFLGIKDSLPNVAIDVIQGPHSQLPWPAGLTTMVEKSGVRLHQECRVLPLLHAAADLVICPGGYNSLLEAMEGGAPVITISVQPDSDGEQFLLASRLAKHYPITIMSDYDQLAKLIAHALDCSRRKLSIRQIGTLNLNGLRNSRDVILASVKASRSFDRGTTKITDQ